MSLTLHEPDPLWFVIFNEAFFFDHDRNFPEMLRITPKCIIIRDRNPTVVDRLMYPVVLVYLFTDAGTPRVHVD